MRLNTQNLLDYLSYPLKALFSKQFYFKVLFSLKGSGFLYLFLLSMVFAIPATYKSMQVVEFFKGLELSRLVAQLPPSYLDEQGVLSPNDDNDSYKLIYSSKGQPAIIYNTKDQPLQGDASNAPVEFMSSAILVHTEKGDANITYNSIFETGTNFHPMQIAQMIDEVLSSSSRIIWSAMVLWSLVLLVINTFITACISRIMMLFIFKIRIAFGSALRLCAFANTIVAVLILAQFFVYLPISYTLMIIFPLLYIGAFSHAFRKELSVIGIEAFKEKYSNLKRKVPQDTAGVNANFEVQGSNADKNDAQSNSGLAEDNDKQEASTQLGENASSNEQSACKNSQASDKKDHDDKHQGPGCFEA